MTSVVVEREKFLDMMREWLRVSGVTEKGKLEVFSCPMRWSSVLTLLNARS